MGEPSNRRTSARIKSEPGKKRKFSDAVEESNSTPSKGAKIAKTSRNLAHKKRPSQPKPVQEPAGPILPTKVTESIPLPVLKEFQPIDLKDTEWQTTMDSGVFAAALVRARQAVIHGAYLERYWFKPVAVKRQKDMTEEEKVQFKLAKGPTMTKFGDATLISEPLRLKIQLLMVKNPNPRQTYGQLPPDRYHLVHGMTPIQTMSPAQHAPYRPLVQYQPPATPRPLHQPTPSPSVATSHGLTAPSPRTTTPVQSVPYSAPVPPASTSTPAPQVTAPPARTSTPVQPVPSSAPSPSASKPTSLPQTTAAAPHPKSAVPPQQHRTASPHTQAKPAAPGRVPASTAPPAPDPVIHALAQRASANEELKAIMRIVATGKANPDQLQYFQRHIDELTEMVKLRQAQDARARAPARPPPPAPLPPQQAPRALTPQVANPGQQGVFHAGTPTPVARQSTTPYYHQHTPAPPRPKPKAAPPLYVLIQFNENPNERFLFPKNSILEFTEGFTAVICSFIALKKRDDKEYWTPVTIVINDIDEKERNRVLTILGRVVEPAHIAKAYMEGIFERHERAEEGYLALRLPKEQLALGTL